MKPQQQNLYNTIARNIAAKEGQCVLILGPEVFVSATGNNYKEAFPSFISPASKSIYFPSENLFHLDKKEKEDGQIIGKIIDFYQKPGENKLLEKISNIKFPLIINAAPDKSLNYIFDKKKIEYSSGYLYIDNTPEDKSKIKEPTKEHPVIYNIFGSIELENSLLLCHYNLILTIEYLFSQKESIPESISRYLKKCNSYIFIGFNFDSWYFLLLCHKLGIKQNFGNGSRKQIYTSVSAEKEEVKIIISDTFDLNPIEDTPIDCINSILEVCHREYQSAIRKNSFNIYISYGHNDEGEQIDRECIVRILQKIINSRPDSQYTLYLDKDKIKPSDNIKEFMTEIGKGKIVIVVISHKYLTSYHCLLEALYIHDNIDSDKKVFYLLFEDNIIKKDNNKIDEIYYKEAWDNKLQEKFNDPIFRRTKECDEYWAISRFIDKYIENINDLFYIKLKSSDLDCSDIDTNTNNPLIVGFIDSIMTI